MELEKEGEETSLELEMTWPTEEGTVETGVDASKARAEMYRDAADEWRWRLVHDNGNVIADSGEGYETMRDAENGLDSVRENAPGARLVDLSLDETSPDEAGTSATFELYRDTADEWRWRLVHDNGNIVADGGQGYSSKQKAKQGLRSVRTNVRGARVDEV